MTTRAQLEEILAAQRARKLRPPAPRGRGRGLISALAVIAILAASAAAMFFAVQWSAPKASATTTALPSVLVTSSSTAVSATPVALKVCTDIPEGRLHVRFAAGDGSEVRGYLTEGEAVQVALGSDGELNSQMIQGDQWLRLTSPVAGWVNARYLCKSE